MKFIRNGKIRDRIIDTVAKGILIAFSALVCLWMISGARAAGVDIKDIRQKALENGSYSLEFVLSKKVAKEDVSVDFERNFIQLSLRGVSAYPARTEQINHGMMEKVFTYQYQPDLARARLLLTGPASAIKDFSSLEVNKNIVKIVVAAGGGQVVSTQQDNVKTKASAPLAKETAVAADPEEQKMREEIIQETAGGAKAKKEEAKKQDSESLPLFSAQGPQATIGTKEKGSAAGKIFASLLLVVGLIGAGALAFRRFVQGKGIVFQRQGKMIDVISSQSLGPKRSIALVKVLDQHLVVGMSGDGMTLLANLGNEVNLDRFSDDVGIGASFTDTLHTAITGGSAEKGTASSARREPVADMGFRASIKKRLEGFKPL
jgi:flagellar biogenesis protein FliO